MSSISPKKRSNVNTLRSVFQICKDTQSRCIEYLSVALSRTPTMIRRYRIQEGAEIYLLFYFAFLTPYLDRLWLRNFRLLCDGPLAGSQSFAPRTTW